jgi:hypothetical protein
MSQPSSREVFEEFFQLVSKHFSLEISEVRKACCRTAKPTRPVSKVTKQLFEEAAAEFKVTKKVTLAKEKSPAESKDTLKKEWGKMKVDELKKACKLRGMKVSGKKSDLIHRLENPGLAENRAKGKSKSIYKGQDLTKVLNVLNQSYAARAIRKNDQGYYVDLETQFVFDPVTKRVMGKWKDDQVKHLNQHDVEKCIELRFAHEIPENLDYGVTRVTDDKVEQLDEDDFKDDEEDSEEEVESEGEID